MKKTLVAGLLSVGLLVGFGTSNAEAMNGTGASTQVKNTTLKDKNVYKSVKSYKYYTVTNLYLPEVPTKSQKATDKKRALKVTNDLRMRAKEQYSYDIRGYNNRTTEVRRTLSGYTRNVTNKVVRESKTQLAIEVRYYQSEADRHEWVKPTPHYKYKYEVITYNKKTGSIKSVSKMRTKR